MMDSASNVWFEVITDIYLLKLNKPAIRDFIFRTQKADSNYIVDGVKLFM